MKKKFSINFGYINFNTYFYPYFYYIHKYEQQFRTEKKNGYV